MNIVKAGLLIGLLALAAGCNREEILEGERIDIRAPFGGAAQETNLDSAPIRLPGQSANASWTQRQGTNAARPQHPALSDAPQPLWRVSIGAGDSRRVRLATDPVVADGRIYTLDARARVQATSAAGAVLWSADLTPARDARASASGGALAVGGGRLYVASAYAFVAALDAETGTEIWRTEFDAPLTGSPAFDGERLYVTALDSTNWALDATSGRILWTTAGTPSVSTVARGSAPAIAGSLVVFPTNSGELTAVNRSNGGVAWTTAAVGRRTGSALATISALTGDPVVDGSRIYAANQSGRTFAIDARSGEAIWAATEGAYGPVWPVGGAVFLISDENRLVRLNASDGSPVWARELPLFTTERVRWRAEIYTQHGPVLAGGRLWVASGDGALTGFDPVTGQPGITLEVPDGAASAPVVAGGVMYVLGRDGTLNAYR